MKITHESVSNYLSQISGVFFILLYPVYAIYNTLIAYGLFPPIFGGFFGFFSALYLVFCLPVFFNISQKFNQRGYAFLLAAFFAYVFGLSIINYFFNYSFEIGLAFKQNIETLLLLLSSVFLGYYIDLNKRLYRILFFFLISAALLLLAYVMVTGKIMFYAKGFAVDGNVEAVSTYQGYARSFLVCALFLLAMTRKIKNYLFVFLISVFILFINGARSELVGFIFAGSVFLLLKYKFTVRSFWYYSLLLSAVILFFYFGLEKLEGSRILQLGDIDAASSWQSRKILKEIAVKQIKENYILGFFAGHIIDGGSTGTYAHNVLSGWAGFGFFPFVAYFLLCFIPLFDSGIRLLKNSNQSVYVDLCFLLSASVLLLVLVAKSIFWFVPGLLFGLYLKIGRYKNV